MFRRALYFGKRVVWVVGNAVAFLAIAAWWVCEKLGQALAEAMRGV